jgi:hypothetical protein
MGKNELFFPTRCPKYAFETARARVSGTYPRVSGPPDRAVNLGVSGPPRPDQLLWSKDMSFDRNIKFVDEIGLGWSNKILMFAKRQINPNKTKHEYIPIETRDIKNKSKWETPPQRRSVAKATRYEYKGMAPRRYILGPKPRLIN